MYLGTFPAQAGGTYSDRKHPTPQTCLYDAPNNLREHFLRIPGLRHYTGQMMTNYTAGPSNSRAMSQLLMVVVIHYHKKGKLTASCDKIRLPCRIVV